ncbi:MAG: hypothetical protein ABIP44_11165 [Pseudoxanthomonas sp.]
MLWWTMAALFLWLALREVYHGFVAKRGFLQPQEIQKSYVLILLLIAAAFAYTPYKYWRFEQFLTAKARILSGSSQASVHCNTLFDTLIDPMSLASGHADPVSGRIVFQPPWCRVLMDHLRHPEKMDREGIFSLQMFAHEAMHVRGELNEAITECQAVQRHARAARLLGVAPDTLATQSATAYYRSYYPLRKQIGGMQAPYHSDECAPGKALDENLQDSTWAP